MIAPSFRPRKIRHVFMDWDGTTSLTRGGWSDVMVGLFTETLPLMSGETPDSLRAFSREELMKLNGRPSIHQMTRLSELVAARKGAALSPDEYQREYQTRVGRVVNARLDRIRTGERLADSVLVPGVRRLFAALNEREIGVTLASGTPLPELLDEVRLLNLEHHFAGIHGPHDLEDRSFSKRAILHRLMADCALDGPEVLAFGDGPVELIETLAVGGVAVGVATDESAPLEMDPWKRDSLLAVGAHGIVPNFLELRSILETFFP
jgi:phosphoglycolate phosphatase